MRGFREVTHVTGKVMGVARHLPQRVQVMATMDGQKLPVQAVLPAALLVASPPETGRTPPFGLVLPVT